MDYKDVLDQAVINERYRTLREVREAITKISTTDSYYAYENAKVWLKTEALRAITRLETP